MPVFPDIKQLTGDEIDRKCCTIDIISGGYPCQPFSNAGKRRGADDDRHLWPELYRIVQEIRPRWCVFENVAGHITLGLDQVLSDMESAGYTSWTLVIPAAAVDAPHRRERIWIVANATGFTRNGCKTNNQTDSGRTGKPGTGGGTGFLGNTFKQGLERLARHEAEGSESGRVKAHKDRSATKTGICKKFKTWVPESGICRVVNGVPDRVDRLRSLGNAVVPQIPEIIGKTIIEFEEMM